MNLEIIDKLIEDKLNKDNHFISFSFYELRIENNLSEEDVDIFLKLTKIKLENYGYKVYFTNDEYQYREKINVVNSNQLMIAIRE